MRMDILNEFTDQEILRSPALSAFYGNIHIIGKE